MNDTTTPQTKVAEAEWELLREVGWPPYPSHLPEKLEAENARLRGALKQIAEGKGEFSLDPLMHASNTIESMIAIAKTALAEP